MNQAQFVKLFRAEVQRLYARIPAPYQLAIAVQRWEKGQSVREIADALYEH